MTITREQMLQRLREAVAAGNRAGGSPPLPQRGVIGYQGVGADPVTRFRNELASAGGQTHLVADHVSAAAVVLDLVRAHSARRVLLGGGDVLAALAILEPLRAIGIEVEEVGTAGAEVSRDVVFQADLGLSGVDYLIAETGSLVLTSRPGQPRSLSLLPPVHIAVAERRQILPDLFDLFAALGTDELPANVSIITGPSKTGDIELRLVTGVHGPGAVHVVLIDSRADLG